MRNKVKIKFLIFLICFLVSFTFPDSPEREQSKIKKPSSFDRIAWMKLHGPWAMSYYGGEGDGYLGKKVAASYHGLRCPDYNHPESFIPDRVNNVSFAVAMPGPWFYCTPIKICYNNKCLITTAVDSPQKYRLKKDGQYYHHIDTWPAVAQFFDSKEDVIWGNVDIYIGAMK